MKALNKYNGYETMSLEEKRIIAEDILREMDEYDVFHYRDKTGLECDAVIHLRNGQYGLIEIKLGGDKLINEGAENLLKLAGKIDSEKMKEPAFMMVLCGVAPFAYRREDGVYVVPVASLKN